MQNKPLTIGKLAESAGVNVETIRYYQKIGLLKTPLKPPSGYRQYSHNSIAIINFIKRSQKLGFSLTEINELISLGENKCDDVCNYTKQKRNQIEDQINELKELQKNLDTLIKSCQSDLPVCPIVTTLLKN